MFETTTMMYQIMTHVRTLRFTTRPERLMVLMSFCSKWIEV